MKKTLKVFFCVVAIMAIITCNVCATWANETPYFNTEVDLMYTENIRSENSAELLMECVDNAYELGLFGGAVPIACVTAESVIPGGYEETAFGLFILCSAPVFYGNSDTLLKSEEYATLNTGSLPYNIAPTYTDFIVTYVMLNSGDVWATNGTMEAFPLSTSGDELIVIFKTETGEWSYNTESPLFAQYYNEDTSANAGLSYINEKYENALSESGTPVEPEEPPIIQNYLLDIPSIITAIPNSAKQIINNTFGFELFGINIAGLLSVFIIIAIVAYAVKKMMSR